MVTFRYIFHLNQVYLGVRGLWCLTPLSMMLQVYRGGLGVHVYAYETFLKTIFTLRIIIFY